MDHAVPLWENEDEVEELGVLRDKEGLIQRLKEHLQGRNDRLLLAELAKRCDPAAWAAIDALPSFFPKGDN